MALRGTDPESYITEYTLAYEEKGGGARETYRCSRPAPAVSHMQTHTIYKLGFNQNYYTFTFLLLIKIVMCSKFP